MWPKSSETTLISIYIYKVQIKKKNVTIPDISPQAS